MLNKFWILLICAAAAFRMSAQQEVYNYGDYSVAAEGTSIKIMHLGNTLSEINFDSPEEYSVDLDGDSLDEFLVIDHTGDSVSARYVLYLFNTIDSVYIADSINSGYYAPYFTVSEESGEMIIVTGNSLFMQYCSGDVKYLPINCYRYDSGEIYNINDELYEVFTNENETLLDFLDGYFNVNARNCSSTVNVKSAVAAAYTNYINAGETTMAHQLIEKYYYCNDRDDLEKTLNNLIENEKEE